MSDTTYAGAQQRPLEDCHLPWYRNPAEPHPFHLKNTILPNDLVVSPLYTVALFPWNVDSLETLWFGGLSSPDFLPDWHRMIDTWSGSIAIGGVSILRVRSVLKSTASITVKLPHDQGEVRNVGWALSHDAPLEPLIVFSGSKMVYVLNVQRRSLISTLRGHGGPITSVAVHPTHPYLFCTTSKDFTTRIYDLTLTPQLVATNPVWPPSTIPSLAGAAHGLHITGREGEGMGRCIAILCGGRSGGHQDAVLGAAFHPSLPLIATCGRDRVVKIWRLPPLSETLAREDKPLFSSSRIHKARVCSITWLSQDILITHSAPALMRRSEEPEKRADVYFESGTMVMWRWLGLDRFFPPESLEKPPQKALRGCASDFQESSSFKIISVTPLPIIPTPHEHLKHSPHVCVFRSPVHDPMALLSISTSNVLRLVNLTYLSPRDVPPFSEDAEMVEMAQRMTLEGVADPEDGIDEKQPGWDISVCHSVGPDNERIEACAIDVDGVIIVGVGSSGSIWIWVAEK